MCLNQIITLVTNVPWVSHNSFVRLLLCMCNNFSQRFVVCQFKLEAVVLLTFLQTSE